MTKVRWIGLGIGVLLIVAAFGLVVWQEHSLLDNSGIALAQGGATPTPTTPAPNSTPAPKAPTNNIGDTFWAALAAKLGISVDDLKTKAVEVRKDMLDQAVKDGRITQADADAIKAKIDANGLIEPIPLGVRGRNVTPGQPRGAPKPFGGPNGRPGFYGAPFGGVEELEAVAKAVKLSPTELVTQLRSNKTLADIAKAQSVDEATVKQAIIDAAKARLARQVQDGLLTQAQADQLQANLTPDKIDLTHPFGFFRFGFR